MPRGLRRTAPASLYLRSPAQAQERTEQTPSGLVGWVGLRGCAWVAWVVVAWQISDGAVGGHTHPSTQIGTPGAGAGRVRSGGVVVAAASGGLPQRPAVGRVLVVRAYKSSNVLSSEAATN